ncbi:leucine-rich repeat domain-containing protein [Candidatus Berkiella cookevillensis]|uniref:Leucine Rich repeats (2 copies) n=1 Tax=Candidatus Berkiella cookevillensis TaxID=437022 RepID=A0A0Q9YNP8_9GAMM|nr:leucine-rich repeat domain-containing protein [Candidatus Berkiella cookevillensis]MCS5709709.1 leucine-rich repeat domain-containing protein [Candidatus Berkiella cookevillensis]
MLDLLADELLLNITQYLPLKARLQFAATAHRNYRLSDDSLSLKKKLLEISAPLAVEPTLHSYHHYCKSRIIRFKQEIAFFQSRQNDVLAILGNTPFETLFLIKLLKKATEINFHFERSGDEKYIVQFDRVLNILNARLINRQLRKGLNTDNLELSCISRLPEHIITQHEEYFRTVRRCQFQDNCLETLPENIDCFEALQSLNLYDNPISFLPRCIGRLANLEYFYLSDGFLRKLPTEFFDLINLKWLALSNMQLEILPKDIEKLQALTWLYLGNNRIEILPKEIATLPKLGEIFLEHNALRICQSSEIKKFFKLRRIDWKNVLKTQRSLLHTKIESAEDRIDGLRCLALNLEEAPCYLPMRERARSSTGNIESLDLETTKLKERFEQLSFRS